jgi:hypothetical protein
MTQTQNKAARIEEIEKILSKVGPRNITPRIQELMIELSILKFDGHVEEKPINPLLRKYMYETSFSHVNMSGEVCKSMEKIMQEFGDILIREISSNVDSIYKSGIEKSEPGAFLYGVNCVSESINTTFKVKQ